MKKQIGLALLLALGTSLAAFGQANLQLTIANSGGQYLYSGGTNPLSGVNLGITQITGNGTTNSGSSPIEDGLLNFTTGAGTGVWTWGSGGSLSITGCIETVVSGPCIAGETTSTTLVSDTFTSASLVALGGGFGITLGGVTGTLDPTVAAYFGVGTAFTAPSLGFGYSDNVTNLPAVAGAAFGSTPFNSVKPTTPGGTVTLDVTNVPEAWSLESGLGLFGFGMLALIVARRLGLIKAIA